MSPASGATGCGGSTGSACAATWSSRTAASAATPERRGATTPTSGYVGRSAAAGPGRSVQARTCSISPTPPTLPTRYAAYVASRTTSSSLGANATASTIASTGRVGCPTQGTTTPCRHRSIPGSLADVRCASLGRNPARTGVTFASPEATSSSSFICAAYSHSASCSTASSKDVHGLTTNSPSATCGPATAANDRVAAVAGLGLGT